MEPHVVSQMGAMLQSEVERQLLADLDHYRPGSSANGCRIDWSNPCQEGHCTKACGGVLESMSDVLVRDVKGSLVAEGWVDFVHGGSDLPLHVFWLFLDLVEGASTVRVKDDVAIPVHVWDRLNVSSRDACATKERYDSNWINDPKVQTWQRERGLM